jgi:hypothetical protein
VRQNPFHVLGLPIDAGDDDIAERSKELAGLAKTDEERKAVLEARRALITHPDTRRTHELTEAPSTSYRHEEWDTFEHHNRRPPIDRAALDAAAVPLRRTDVDVHALVTSVLDELLHPPAVDIRPAVADPPVRPSRGQPPFGVSDVLFG